MLFLCYAAELALRVLAFGLKGFTKPWIVFDLLLVLMGCTFYIVNYSTSLALDPGASSSLRIIRIARVLRFFRFRCLELHTLKAPALCGCLNHKPVCFAGFHSLTACCCSASLKALLHTILSILPGVWSFASIVR